MLQLEGGTRILEAQLSRDKEDRRFRLRYQIEEQVQEDFFSSEATQMLQFVDHLFTLLSRFELSHLILVILEDALEDVDDLSETTITMARGRMETDSDGYLFYLGIGVIIINPPSIVDQPFSKEKLSQETTQFLGKFLVLREHLMNVFLMGIKEVVFASHTASMVSINFTRNSFKLVTNEVPESPAKVRRRQEKEAQRFLDLGKS